MYKFYVKHLAQQASSINSLCMPRYALKIEYNGKGFAGWQRQKSHKTIQGEIEASLKKLDPEITSIFGAGRTDAGVHATSQIAHCDLIEKWDNFKLKEALNFHLKPNKISVLDVNIVPDKFHARFSATKRKYLFRLISRRPPLAIEAGLAWHVKYELKLKPMLLARKYFIGKHDFTTFRSSSCQSQSPVKTIESIEIKEIPISHGFEYQFEFTAPSFLQNQVRSLVGTLEKVGSGVLQPRQVKSALEAKDRSFCGPVSPPDGLYLVDVIYPKNPFQCR